MLLAKCYNGTSKFADDRDFSSPKTPRTQLLDPSASGHRLKFIITQFISLAFFWSHRVKDLDPAYDTLHNEQGNVSTEDSVDRVAPH